MLLVICTALLLRHADGLPRPDIVVRQLGGGTFMGNGASHTLAGVSPLLTFTTAGSTRTASVSTSRPVLLVGPTLTGRRLPPPPMLVEVRRRPYLPTVVGLRPRRPLVLNYADGSRAVLQPAYYMVHRSGVAFTRVLFRNNVVSVISGSRLISGTPRFASTLLKTIRLGGAGRARISAILRGNELFIQWNTLTPLVLLPDGRNFASVSLSPAQRVENGENTLVNGGAAVANENEVSGEVKPASRNISTPTDPQIGGTDTGTSPGTGTIVDPDTGGVVGPTTRPVVDLNLTHGIEPTASLPAQEQKPTTIAGLDAGGATGPGTTGTTTQDVTPTTGQETSAASTGTSGGESTGSTREDTAGPTEQDITGTTGGTRQDTTVITVPDTAGATGGTGQDTTRTTGQDTTGAIGQDTTGTTGQESTGTTGQETTETTEQHTPGTSGQDAIGTSEQDATDPSRQDTVGDSEQASAGENQPPLPGKDEPIPGDSIPQTVQVTPVPPTESADIGVIGSGDGPDPTHARPSVSSGSSGQHTLPTRGGGAGGPPVSVPRGSVSTTQTVDISESSESSTSASGASSTDLQEILRTALASGRSVEEILTELARRPDANVTTVSTTSNSTSVVQTSTDEFLNRRAIRGPDS